MRRIITVALYLLLPFLPKAQKTCSQHEYEQLLIGQHAGLADRLAAAGKFQFSRAQTIASNTGVLYGVAAPATGAVPEQVVIPVVVHIVSLNGSNLVSDEQVHAQIAALNRDFNARNADLANVPSYFAEFVANVGISFELARFDPVGKPTTGIIRKGTSIQQFVMDDRVKFSSRGGDDAWDSDRYLNIWVCNMLSGIQGYSTKPGSPKNIDGVVLSRMVFGQSDPTNQFHMGRIGVHEVGHWLGLKHIWGEGYCGDDNIDDTPSQKSYTKGCPSGEIFSCGTTAHGDMYMNFMDMTDDACMYMFTHGQRAAMRAAFERGGPRNQLLFSPALGGGTTAEIDYPTGEQTVKSIVTLYPVPARDQLTISVTDSEFKSGRRMLVYNSIGQVSMTVILNSRVQQINISSLRTGQYYLQIEGGVYKGLRFLKM